MNWWVFVKCEPKSSQLKNQRLKFSLCVLNLFKQRVSQFELNYWNKWTFPRCSNLLRCTCKYLKSQYFTFDFSTSNQKTPLINKLLKTLHRSCWLICKQTHSRWGSAEMVLMGLSLWEWTVYWDDSGKTSLSCSLIYVSHDNSCQGLATLEGCTFYLKAWG